MQAKDISDTEMLTALANTRGMNGVLEWSALSNVEDALPHIHPKLVLAKLRSMIRRKVIEGWGAVVGATSNYRCVVCAASGVSVDVGSTLTVSKSKYLNLLRTGALERVPTNPQMSQ